jgi:hypothetical protein
MIKGLKTILAWSFQPGVHIPASRKLELAKSFVRSACSGSVVGMGALNRSGRVGKLVLRVESWVCAWGAEALEWDCEEKSSIYDFDALGGGELVSENIAGGSKLA